MPPLRSRTSTKGRNRTGARAPWRATGRSDSDFGTPIVAIANSMQASASMASPASTGAVRQVPARQHRT